MYNATCKLLKKKVLTIVEKMIKGKEEKKILLGANKQKKPLI